MVTRERENYHGWLAAIELLAQIKDEINKKGRVGKKTEQNIDLAIEEFEVQTEQVFILSNGSPRLTSKT